MFNQYGDGDTWNSDEVALFLCEFSRIDVVEKASVGIKQQEGPLTFSTFGNASGTENFPLRIIKKPRRPRALGPKFRKELGFGYGSNKKARITKKLSVIV